MYNFKSGLNAGHAGEVRFNKLFPCLTRTDGKIADFILPNGHTLELKTERRTTDMTPNLALELNSSIDRPGAIERAVLHKINYITYLYADNAYYTYLSHELLSFMYENQNKFRTIMVPNQGYETLVLLVPRSAVAHLALDLNKILCTSGVA